MEELKEKLEKEIKERYQKQLTELNALHVNEIEAVNRECAATVRKARSDLETAQKQAELSQLELETLRQEHKAIVEEYDAIQIEFNTFKNETHEGAKVIYEKTQNDRQRFMDLDADVETLMKKLESTNSMNHDLQKAYNEALEEIKSTRVVRPNQELHQVHLQKQAPLRISLIVPGQARLLWSANFKQKTHH